ncbi:response regulator transcription factor [Thermoflexus sp.]|uniref:response regulator transcription factor n=2 Tax=Thermoflexus sp. TaxID=1969742 RepID=UPI0026004746|nr:response regulator transcription factor [Thermoflexus sp.]MCS6963645.1 response regulator transcription factor [Thermoflexus sp.]MCX7691274.1 response regulator transcription factor [Thermoflexus sp.]MDW8185550.1 response regulator transcription factor [Anaerolineae bacterium]
MMNGKALILLIDDDALLRDLLTRALIQNGYEVLAVGTGSEGLSLFDLHNPDVVILDVLLPDIEGWEVCRRIRRVSTVPILFLTALEEIPDRVRGLVLGGDDYIVKPFAVEELLARVEAILRRVRRVVPTASSVLEVGDGALVIDRERRQVQFQGQLLDLSPIEYAILVALAERAGRVVSIDELLTAVWGGPQEGSLQALRWYIWNLRQKMEANPKRPRWIQTVRRQGYRLNP